MSNEEKRSTSGREAASGKENISGRVRRAAALMGVVLLVGLYLVTFVLAILGNERSTQLLRFCFGMTIFVPLFIDGITDRYVLIPILYLSVLSSVVAFLLQNYSVTYLSLAKATVFENIIPVISVAAGVIFLGEPFSLIQLTGIVLILLGVWKVTTEKSLDSQAS